MLSLRGRSDEAIHSFLFRRKNGLLRGACHRARIRATGWLAMTLRGSNNKEPSRMPHPLDSFFAPESIALIGASRDHEKIPGRLLSMLRKNDYPAAYPIIRSYAIIDGLKMHKSIAEVGQPVDLACHHPGKAVLARSSKCAAVASGTP